VTSTRNISHRETRQCTWRVKVIDGPRIIDPSSGRGRVGINRFDYFVVEQMLVQFDNSGVQGPNVTTPGHWVVTLIGSDRNTQRSYGWAADEDIPSSFPADLRPFVRDYVKQVG